MLVKLGAPSFVDGRGCTGAQPVFSQGLNGDWGAKAYVKEGEALRSLVLIRRLVVGKLPHHAVSSSRRTPQRDMISMYNGPMIYPKVVVQCSLGQNAGYTCLIGRYTCRTCVRAQGRKLRKSRLKSIRCKASELRTTRASQLNGEDDLIHTQSRKGGGSPELVSAPQSNLTFPLLQHPLALSGLRDVTTSQTEEAVCVKSDRGAKRVTRLPLRSQVYDRSPVRR